MKTKNFITAILILALSGSVNSTLAQKNNSTTVFTKGTVTVALGIGLGKDYMGDNKYYKSTNGFGTKAALDFGIWPAGPGVISLGLETGGTFTTGKSNVYNDFRSRTIIIAGRSAWHNGWKVAGLDTYAGVSTGVGFRHYEYNNSNHYTNNDAIPVFGGFIGASYFFSPAFGVNIEAGSDITQLQAGVIFKLR